LLDALLCEYPWPSYVRNDRLHGPDDYLIWRYPLARAFALYAAIGPRYGAEAKGPTYVEAAMIRAKREVEAAAEPTF
jgi:hypothetical protein